MRLSSVCAAGATGVMLVACGVDYRVDQSAYERRLCELDASACDASTGGAGDGGAGGTDGTGGRSSGGTGGLGNTGGFGTGGLGTGGLGTGGASACVSGEQSCSSSTVAQTCVGGSWVPSPCTAPTPECENGTCVVCANGSRRCAGTTPETCSSHAWVPGTACTGTQICQGGACVIPPSCVGAVANCGSAANDTCCASPPVPGGTYYHGGSATQQATVSGFLLDKYEVTVGRFRKFAALYPANMPAAGAGAHPKIPGSGWDPAWSVNLPVAISLLNAALACNGYATWTDTPGANENKPLNCLSWYLAFAFCAWDGGRLPTDTEWNYAASAGFDQRLYPWGNTAPPYDATVAIYECYYSGGVGTCSVGSIAPVGSAPAGAGKWGQLDLGGNVEEWALDYNDAPYPSPCNDCSRLTGGSVRSLRGGYFSAPASYLLNSTANAGSASYGGSSYGVRCARNP